MASISTVLFLNWLPEVNGYRTLGREVEGVIERSVDFVGGSVLSEQAPEDTLSPDPEDLSGHSALAGTLALTEAGVSAEALGFSVAAGTGAGVHDSLPLHD
jgi:hypothetical protein